MNLICLLPALVLASERAKAAIKLQRVALHYHQLAQEQKAATYYLKAIALDPTAAVDSYSNLGALSYARGAIEEAQHYFEAAILLKGGYSPADYYNLAHLLTEQRGRHHEAAIHCRQALRQRRGYTKAHHLLGNILQALANSDRESPTAKRRLEEADEHYRVAEALSQGQSQLELSKEFYPPRLFEHATLPPQASRRVLSGSEPHVSLLTGLLSKAECAHIITLAKEERVLERSSTTNEQGSSSARVSGRAAVHA